MDELGQILKQNHPEFMAYHNALRQATEFGDTVSAAKTLAFLTEAAAAANNKYLIELINAAVYQLPGNMTSGRTETGFGAVLGRESIAHTVYSSRIIYYRPTIAEQLENAQLQQLRARSSTRAVFNKVYPQVASCNAALNCDQSLTLYLAYLQKHVFLDELSLRLSTERMKHACTELKLIEALNKVEALQQSYEAIKRVSDVFTQYGADLDLRKSDVGLY